MFAGNSGGGSGDTISETADTPAAQYKGSARIAQGD